VPVSVAYVKRESTRPGGGSVPEAGFVFLNRREKGIKLTMKVCILFPGKIKPKALMAAQDEYIRRLKGFGVEIAAYKDEKIASQPPGKVRQAEADRILKRLRPDDYLVACDERGSPVRTMDLADMLRAFRQGDPPLAGKSRIVIVIGGALGLAEPVRTKADAVWALSPLVMAGGIARLVLLEGIYRAFTVVAGHPYHNE
jgi:23S rRNA (pseudouridine1915-N3)-methyltransferase